MTARLDPATALALADPGAACRRASTTSPTATSTLIRRYPDDLPARRRPRSRTARRTRRRGPGGPAVTAAATARIRIGIDTGGTFTDVVAVDEATGADRHDQDAVHAGRPGRRASWPASTRCSTAMGAGRRPTWPRSATAPRSRPTSCSRARSASLGFITTEGYEHVLEIARQSRARRLRQLLLLGEAAADRAGRPGADGRRAARPYDGSRGPAVRRGRRPSRRRGGSATRASTRSASASCTPTPNPATSARCARCCAREHPDAVVSHLQRGAARVPRVRAGDDDAGRRRGEADGCRATSRTSRRRLRRRSTGRGVPFYVMKSNGGVLSADEVVHQPITTVLSGPAAGALGAALVAARRPASTGCSPATAAARRPTSRWCSTASPR